MMLSLSRERGRNYPVKKMCWGLERERGETGACASLMSLSHNYHLIYRSYAKHTVVMGVSGTPPRLTFQARLLHNQEDVNTNRYV